ncbi:hypothetical protein BKA81DRAFT_377833 [Phyllosticta paracitricarpa]
MDAAAAAATGDATAKTKNPPRKKKGALTTEVIRGRKRMDQGACPERKYWVSDCGSTWLVKRFCKQSPHPSRSESGIRTLRCCCSATMATCRDGACMHVLLLLGTTTTHHRMPMPFRLGRRRYLHAHIPGRRVVEESNSSDGEGRRDPLTSHLQCLLVFPQAEAEEEAEAAASRVGKSPQTSERASERTREEKAKKKGNQRKRPPHTQGSGPDEAHSPRAVARLLAAAPPSPPASSFPGKKKE